MSQPTVGFGKFLYGRALYGQMQITTGAFASSAAWSSTVAGSAHKSGKVGASTWTWSSTSVAHPIEAGRMAAHWTETAASHGALHAVGAVDDLWTWSSASAGVRKPIGAYAAQWTETSRVVASLHADAIYVANAVLTSAADGRKLWEADAPDPDPGWAPQPKPTSIWTPVPEGMSPWTRMHR